MLLLCLRKILNKFILLGYICLYLYLYFPIPSLICEPPGGSLYTFIYLELSIVPAKEEEYNK